MNGSIQQTRSTAVTVNLRPSSDKDIVSGDYFDALDQWAGNNPTKLAIAAQISAQGTAQNDTPPTSLQLDLDNASEFDLLKKLPIPRAVTALSLRFTNMSAEDASRNALDLVKGILSMRKSTQPLAISIDVRAVMTNFQTDQLQCQLLAIQRQYELAGSPSSIIVVGSGLDDHNDEVVAVQVSADGFGRDELDDEQIDQLVQKQLNDEQDQVELSARPEGEGERDRIEEELEAQIEGLENEFEPGLLVQGEVEHPAQ